MVIEAVEAENLTKSFNGVLAVDHISFRVRRGEIFGFLGPNGAGKTTTVRMLTGILKPDEGSAYIMGLDIEKNVLEAKQIMGVVPETSNAYVDLSAWDNLILIAELYDVPKDIREERSVELLKKFGLYERRKQLVKGFSKGMKQRLMLCMALINNPEILFLDEPTSGLDVQSTRLIRETIRELNKGGVTVFLSTHNMEEADKLCEKVAVISHGRIAVIDSPENLKKEIKGLNSVSISFNREIDFGDMSRFVQAVKIEKMGDKLYIYTEDLDETIYTLIKYARKKNLKIESLTSLSPSLEDVFIRLTEGYGA